MDATAASPYKLGNGRLREDGVRRIRSLRQEGKTYQAIASEVEVSLGTVYNIVTGKTWKDFQ